MHVVHVVYAQMGGKKEELIDRLSGLEEQKRVSKSPGITRVMSIFFKKHFLIFFALDKKMIKKCKLRSKLRFFSRNYKTSWHTF